jgi:hypothetical protein
MLFLLYISKERENLKIHNTEMNKESVDPRRATVEHRKKDG